MNLPFINIHTHRPEAEQAGIVLLNCFPNGKTTEYEYKEISSFEKEPLSPFKHLLQLNNSDEKSTLLCCGIHPWYIADKDHGKALEVIEALCREKLIHAVGETGISKMREYEHLGVHLFSSQLAIAEKYKLPFIIHCENEYNEIIRLLKQLKPQVPIIFHHFNANIETASQLMKHGFYLSFGSGLMDPKKRSSKAFEKLPLEVIFLETDDRNISVESIYELAAEIKKITVSELKEVIFNNFTKLFGKIA